MLLLLPTVSLILSLASLIALNILVSSTLEAVTCIDCPQLIHKNRSHHHHLLPHQHPFLHHVTSQSLLPHYLVLYHVFFLINFLFLAIFFYNSFLLLIIFFSSSTSCFSLSSSSPLYSLPSSTIVSKLGSSLASSSTNSGIGSCYDQSKH